MLGTTEEIRAKICTRISNGRVLKGETRKTAFRHFHFVIGMASAI